MTMRMTMIPILTILKYYAVIVVVTTTSSSFAVVSNIKNTATAFVIKTTTTAKTKSCSTTRLFFEQNNNNNRKNKQHNNNYEQQQQHGTNSTGTSSTSTELMSSSSATVVAAATSSTRTKYKIYCDLDGCLVNFEKGVQTLLNTGSSNLDKRTMWDSISQVPNWFDKLEWTMDGRRLWYTIKHLNPDILTGVPDIESSRIDKFNWCKRELGLDDQIVHHVDMAADGLEIPLTGGVLDMDAVMDVDVGVAPVTENNSNNSNNNDDSYAWDDNDHGCSSSWTDDHLSVNGNVPRDDKTNVITCWSNNKYKECRTGS